MDRNGNADPQGLQVGLLGTYLKRGMAVIVGIAVAVGFYFFVIKGNAQTADTQKATLMCVCPDCGAMLEKPAGLDCEEIRCPNCSRPMNTGAMLAAAPGGADPAAPNAGVGLAPQGRFDNQTEVFAERGMQAPPGGGVLVGAGRMPAPAEGRAGNPGPDTCVCPNCGKTLQRQPGVPCHQVRCPNCQTFMTTPVFIGRAGPAKGEVQLAGMPGTAHGATQVPGTGAAPCPHVGGGSTTAPCPGAAAGGTHHHFPTASTPMTGNTNRVTYTNTIQPILEKNCYRCHSGPMRNLTTYNRLRPYVDNGLLTMMVQPGGPMSRFVTADEFHTIDGWIKSGAPQ
jgi:hypothetical protein